MASWFNRLREVSPHTAIVLLLLLLLVQQGAWGKIRPTDPRLERISILKTAFGQALKTPSLDNGSSGGTATPTRRASVGGAASGPNSRGALVAQTWRDWQANTNANRTIAVAPVGNSYGTGVQFTYIHKSSSAGSDRSKWGWNGYDAVVGAYVKPGGGPIIIPIAPSQVEAGSYPKVVIYPRNGKGIVGGHDFVDQANSPDAIQLHIAFEGVAFSGNFGNISGGSIVADSLNKSGNLVTSKSYNAIWPAMGMTVSATDTVLYLFAFEGIVDEPYGAAKVFRHLSTAKGNPDNLWQLVYIDSSFFPTLDFSASRVSTRVAAVWVNQTPAGHLSATQQDNDIYYADSPTGLAGTWTKHDLTNYTGAGYRAWLECNSLFDSADKLHIIWNAAVTDGVTFLADRSCRLFHWSEFNPGTFSTIYSALFSAYDLPCIGGSNVMNVGKFSIGECDGRLYTVFSDWNDPQLDPVDDSDCATDGGWLYGGNGELYVSISKDLQGLSWDEPHNLSTSYSKGCDSGSANCADDRFASISEVGIDNNIQPGIWPPSSYVDPTGFGSPDVCTQVLYTTDRYPGGSVLDPPQGPYTLNDIRWIRMACALPILEAQLVLTPSAITYPAYSKPSLELDSVIHLENTGNTGLTFTSIVVQEDSCKGPGCISGWLDYTGINGTSTIPEGVSTNMTVRLNRAGNITNGTAPHRLFGRIVFNYGPPVKATNLTISFTIADSVAVPKFDTIITASTIKLVCAGNGNAGNNYAGKVNMNFNPAVECDTGANMRGDAFVYLGDASPVILRKVGTGATRASWSIFSQGYTNPNGFKPLPAGTPSDPLHGHAPAHTTAAKWQQFFSGTFVTVDSLLKVEKTWYAPTNSPDTANFIVEKLQVWPAHSGTAVSNLAIGAAYDWDIPTDSGSSNNAGGFDSGRKLVYQKGFNSADTVADCFNNGVRYGGTALIAMTNQMFIDSCPYKSDSLYGGYTARNDSFVYPANGFVPEQLWHNMQTPGYSNQGGTGSWTDLHSVLTFRNVQNASNGGWNFPAQARDTLTIWTVMGVVRNASSPGAGLDSLKATIDKGKEWGKFWIFGCKCCSCVGKRGNVNITGIIDLADLTALVSYLTGGGYVLPIWDAANVNGTGIVDLADLTALASYLTGGGFVLVDCN